MLRRVVVVREYERGLFYRDGKFVELLPPGRYKHWRWEHTRVEPVDVREVSQTVEGQEILTGDKIGARVTLIARYRVADPVAARHTGGGGESAGLRGPAADGASAGAQVGVTRTFGQ